jgi:O-antigen/teichoic acid export membrane protein
MTMLFLLLPQFKPLLLWRTFDGVLLRKMLLYGLPLMLAGLAGIANELADRQFLKYLLPEATSMDDLGIYGAIYKLSIFLVLFVQAYRYAAEPFFFRLDSETGDSRQMNARVLRYFTLVLGAVVIGLNAALPVIKHFIDEKFWAGLQAAPILIAANFVLGLNTHLSIWYKLANKTWFAGIVTGVGLLFTIGLNLWWIPQMGWMGAAWATFISYLVMAILNALLGRKYAPVPYAWKVLLTYFISSLLLGFFAWKVQALWGLWALLALLPYLMIVLLIERSTWQHILPQRK